jgi:ring-1,2-phenylacetyl-CoA epoxidase subunit PaaD
MVTRQDILAVLELVPDPELPVSIVQLGLVEDVQCVDNTAHIVLLPTWSGCPALPMIEADVRDRVSALDGVDVCEIQWHYEPAWTPDRISPDGLAKLKQHGVTTPSACCNNSGQSTVTLATSVLPCPYCGSRETRLDSPYGPTRCRAIYFCDGCRNQFEHMKPRGA